MTERERELLTLIKARAKTIAEACEHYKVPGKEPLTILSLLYLVIKIQGGPADQLILQGPVQAFQKILELLNEASKGQNFKQEDVEGPVQITHEQLQMLIHAKMTKESH